MAAFSASGSLCSPRPWSAYISSQQASVLLRADLEGVSQSVAVELRPYSSGDAVFAFSLPRAGNFAGQVKLEGDNLTDDNRRFFTVNVRKALRLLLISDAARDDTTSGISLVATALSPSEYAATGMNVVRRLSQDVDRGALETADAFYLVSPVRLTG